MRKLLMVVVAAAVIWAPAAQASDLGAQVPPNLPYFANSDWDGHGSHHCNNVASVDYWTPGGEAYFDWEGSLPGDSWYTLNPDVRPSEGGRDCRSLTPEPVLIATWYYNGGITGWHTPACDPYRNPCDGKSAIYLRVGQEVRLDGVGWLGDHVSAGQRMRLP